MDETICVFCKNSLEDGDATVVLREKGCEGIRKASEALNKTISTSPGQQVHQSCRRDFVVTEKFVALITTQYCKIKTEN